MTTFRRSGGISAAGRWRSSSREKSPVYLGIKQEQRLQHTDAVDLHAEHGGAEHVARLEAFHLDAVVPAVLVEIDRFHHLDALLQLAHRVDAVFFIFRGGDGQVVAENALHDFFGGGRHEYTRSALARLACIKEATL